MAAMKIDVGDIIVLRQHGAGEPEFVRGRVVLSLPGTNNADWKGFYYRVLGLDGNETGPRLFAYDYSVARVEREEEATRG
ncbi:MAG: hypothetical protein HY720_06635 [Planctomycetes bacterium]|nr:hypothetical protein [Planctomycetota bacterium]